MFIAPMPCVNAHVFSSSYHMHTVIHLYVNICVCECVCGRTCVGVVFV